MSYDPPTIMDKLHDIARVLGIDGVDAHSDDGAVYPIAESLDKMLPIAERIAVALERLADKHAPRPPKVRDPASVQTGECPRCGAMFFGDHTQADHDRIGTCSKTKGPPA